MMYAHEATAGGGVHSPKGEEMATRLLDTDYDGRTFCICQAFLPGGEHQRIAAKVIDFRGNEVVRVAGLG
jgi:adenine-specific DNA-methyltransferase